MTSLAAADAKDSLEKMTRDPIASTLRFYEIHAKEYFDRTVSADLSHLYDRFLSCVRAEGRILDAGCGSGRDLRNFRERGFDVVGIDASSALIKLAQEYSGAPCYTVRLEDIVYKRSFDGIWACASLLHLPKLVLAPVLRRIQEALVPGGVMFASVQMGEGETLTPDGRFYVYYQHEEFLRFIEEADFDIEDSWVSEDSLPGRSTIRWINVLARK